MRIDMLINICYLAFGMGESTLFIFLILSLDLNVNYQVFKKKKNSSK